MSFSHEYNMPVFIGTGAVLKQGDTSNLVAGQLGLFSYKDFKAVNGQVPANQDVIIAAGSWHKKDKLNKFWGGLQVSDKSTNFLGRDVIEFHRSRPRRAESEQWVIGWDGISDCDTLSFECGKNYTFKVRVWGEDVYGTFLRPLEVFIDVPTECCDDDDCTVSCNDKVGAKKYAKKMAEIINEHPELKYFVRAEAITDDIVSKTATHRLYQLQVCDTGDMQALAAVQQAYPTIRNIDRIDRNGSTSTYEFCGTIADGAPTDFVPTGGVSLAVCGECPAGYTTQAAQDVYVITRPLAGTETLVTDNNKQTYANTIRTAYNGTTARFLSQNGSVAVIEVKFNSGATVNTLLADSVTKISEQPAMCVPAAGTEIEWTAAGDRYRTSRTLCMKLEKECGTGNRLADLQAFYANVRDIVPNSLILKTAGTCGDEYQIQQYNNDCLVDGCLTEDVPQYDPLQSFEGFAWSTECPCDPTEEEEDVLAGVRIEAAYEDTRFGGCTFSPTDYYSIRPLKIEIVEFDDSGKPCANPVPSRKLRHSSMATQSGEFVIREWIKFNNAYRAYGAFYHDPRMREVLDAEMHEIIDRNAFYNIYYLKVKQNRGNMNGDFAPEVIEMMFAFKEGVDTTAFEQQIENFTSQFGVHLQDR